MEKLTAEQKRLIAARIDELDPTKELVALSPNANFTGGTIAYNRDCGIILHENISRVTDEEYVRAHLVVRLVKQLRYPAESLELENTYAIGRPSPTRAQIDVKVVDRRDPGRPKTFMLIDAKRADEFESYSTLIEGQLFKTGNQEYPAGIRYVAWYSLDLSAGEFRDKCIVIKFRKCHAYAEWTRAGEPGHNLDLPTEYGIVRKQRYVNTNAASRSTAR
jgi:type I restriction enzyme M protein